MPRIIFCTLMCTRKLPFPFTRSLSAIKLPVLLAAYLATASAALVAKDKHDDNGFPEFVEFKLKLGAPERVVDAISKANTDRRRAYDSHRQEFDALTRKIQKGKKGAINAKVKVPRADPKTGNWTFPSVAERSEWVSLMEYERSLTAMYFDSADAAEPLGFLRAKSSTGAFGKLRNPAKVIQVIDESTILIEIKPSDKSPTETLWLTGYSTEGLVDGRSFRLKVPVIITGTKAYENVQGAKRTVLAAEVFDVEPYLEDSNTDSAKKKKGK